MSTEATGLPFMADEISRAEPAGKGQPDALLRLVERARAGEAEAFEQLMICTQQRVVSVAWRMLGNRDDARDAAQEVFLRMFKYLGRFHHGEDFYGWLYRITINVCHDTARRRLMGGRESVSLDAGEGAVDLLTSPLDAEEEAITAQKRAIIWRAAATLGERERAVLVLRDFEGLSTEEVARVLGTRPATVRSQLSLARAKVKLYCDRLLKKGKR